MLVIDVRGGSGSVADQGSCLSLSPEATQSKENPHGARIHQVERQGKRGHLDGHFAGELCKHVGNVGRGQLQSADDINIRHWPLDHALYTYRHCIGLAHLDGQHLCRQVVRIGFKVDDAVVLAVDDNVVAEKRVA